MEEENMRLPVKYLEHYGNMGSMDFNELIDDNGFNGFVIKEVEELLEKTNKIQVGELKEIEKHPDADQLVVIQVCVGEEELVQIVTSATNCNVGDFAPIVRKNGRIANGKKVKRGKMRGVESCGMLCSLEELGYDAALIQDEMVDNIYILNNEKGQYKPGADFKEAIPDVMDKVLTLELTGGALTVESVFKELQKKQIEVEDKHDESVEVLKSMDATISPDWLKIRLMNIGVKPSIFETDRDAYFGYIGKK